MNEFEQMTVEELAVTIENWKILCLDRTYPAKYNNMVKLFKQRASHEPSN